MTIIWHSLRPSLEWTDGLKDRFLAGEKKAGPDTGEVQVHVVDVLVPLTDPIRDQLAHLPKDDLVVILTTGSRSEHPTQTEREFLAAEEQVISTTTASWVIMRCVPLAQEFLGSIRTALNESIFASWREMPVPWLDFRDVLELIPLVAMDPERRSKTYELTGSEALTPGELTRVVSNEAGKPFHYVAMDLEQMVIAVERMGTSRALAIQRAQYMDFSTGPEAIETNDTLLHALGRRPRPASQLIRSGWSDAYEFAKELYSRTNLPGKGRAATAEVADPEDEQGTR
ncbi:hypothetical protein [Kocuria sp.]|uniref:hypothetical protein n=1 Tax=Kocuria sp. TaxID=1871328 RepID=UPI0026DEDA29|nr:hypothetical protein [Kocuria sp.]MDO5619155.1 hypothetical protein [Kocuria sp.]